MVELQTAYMRDAFEHGLGKGFNGRFRAVIGWQHTEHCQGWINNRSVIYCANSMPVIVQKDLLVGGSADVQQRLKAVDNDALRVQAVLQQCHVGENQAGDPGWPRIGIAAFRLPWQMQRVRQIPSSRSGDHFTGRGNCCLELVCDDVAVVGGNVICQLDQKRQIALQPFAGHPFGSDPGHGELRVPQPFNQRFPAVVCEEFGIADGNCMPAFTPL